MIRTLFRWVVRSAVVAGAAAAVLKLVRRGEEAPGSQDGDARAADPGPGSGRGSTGDAEPEPAVPEPPVPEAGSSTVPPVAVPEVVAPGDDGASLWVAPEGDACPASHPIKAKESSGIFHVPGGLAYDRTSPDRCYLDVSSAEADGYRQAKR